jgi:CHAD domain-containing protein
MTPSEVTTTSGPNPTLSDPDLVLPPPIPVGRDSTAGVAVMAHLRRQTAALLAADAGLDTDADGSVHAARVAARRLRSGLRVYGDLLRDDVSARLRPELSWYASRLSPARDLEVFAADLDIRSDLPEGLADTLRPWLVRRRTDSLAAALVDLRATRATTMRASLVSLARTPSFTAVAAKRAAKVLAPRVLHADARATRQFEALTHDDPPESWHSARISAKRARYAAEVGAAALGRPCEELARLWAGLTEPLGHAQDAVIQRELVLARVRDTAVPLSAGEAFGCGVFVASTHERELEAQQQAHARWRSSRDEHRRLRRAVGS